MRNPYAKALRVKPQQILRDKRERTLRQIWNETLKEEVPEDLTDLVQQLRGE
jgi:hypothetical protein